MKTRLEKMEVYFKISTRAALVQLLTIMDPGQRIEWGSYNYSQMLEYTIARLTAEYEAVGSNDQTGVELAPSIASATPIRLPVVCSFCGKDAMPPYVACGNNIFYCNDACKSKAEAKLTEIVVGNTCYFCSSTIQGKPHWEIEDKASRSFCNEQCHKNFKEKVPPPAAEAEIGLDID